MTLLKAQILWMVKTSAWIGSCDAVYSNRALGFTHPSWRVFGGFRPLGS